MDKEHLLYCPKLDTDHQVLKNTIKLYWDVRAAVVTRTTTDGEHSFVPYTSAYMIGWFVYY